MKFMTLVQVGIYKYIIRVSVTLPDSLTKIGVNAFNGCTSLESITIPDSVTKIEPQAFAYCKKVIIRCHAGSCAYEYARMNNKQFEIID